MHILTIFKFWLTAITAKCLLMSTVATRVSVTENRAMQIKMTATGTSYTVGDLKKLSTKTALASVCGPPELLSEESRFPESAVKVMKEMPTVNRFVVANPKAMMENPLIAKSVGLDFDAMDSSMPLSSLAEKLPVIYIGDMHPEYGTLGFLLSKKSDKSMNDIKPELRSFRQTQVYIGGTQNRGNSFTMLHRRQGFPENRALKVLAPGKGGNDEKGKIENSNEFRLYFSPDVAMANELCSTGDAKPGEFKFFQWSTVWLPKQLDLEYELKCWLTLKAPVRAIFEEFDPSQPLWRRLVGSLPSSLLQNKAGQVE